LVAIAAGAQRANDFAGSVLVPFRQRAPQGSRPRRNPSRDHGKSPASNVFRVLGAFIGAAVSALHHYQQPSKSAAGVATIEPAY
jgi:hypothetical protein